MYLMHLENKKLKQIHFMEKRYIFCLYFYCTRLISVVFDVVVSSSFLEFYYIIGEELCFVRLIDGVSSTDLT